MSEGFCVSCGISSGEVPLHDHHVDGRAQSDRTVQLCPNCHAAHHKGYILIDNRAGRAIMAEIEALEAKGHQVWPADFDRLKQKYDYRPWEDQAESQFGREVLEHNLEMMKQEKRSRQQ